MLQYDFSPSATQTVYDNVKYIAFRDTYGAADANYYYQQRWNAHDQDEAPDVRETLGEIKDEQLKQELFELFRIEPMLDKKILSLIHIWVSIIGMYFLCLIQVFNSLLMRVTWQFLLFRRSMQCR